MSETWWAVYPGWAAISADSARLLGKLHFETVEDFDKRTVAANKERGNGTRPGPNDKPQEPPK